MPAERKLAEDLGVSRATLRKGLAGLEAGGLLLRHVGRGTFVKARTADDGVDAGTASGVDASPRQVMTARLALEPSLARIAAREGNREDHRVVTHARAAVADASDRAAYEAADAAFHRSIALASRNPLLIRLHDETIAASEATFWGRLRQRDDAAFARPEAALRDHAEIEAAIRMRDVYGAEAAMTRHLLDQTIVLVGEMV